MINGSHSGINNFHSFIHILCIIAGAKASTTAITHRMIATSVTGKPGVWTDKFCEYYR